MASQKELISGPFFEFNSGGFLYRFNRDATVLQVYNKITPNDWANTTTIESDGASAIEYSFDETNQRWLRLDNTSTPSVFSEFNLDGTWTPVSTTVSGAGDGTGINFDPDAVGGNQGQLSVITRPDISPFTNNYNAAVWDTLPDGRVIVIYTDITTGYPTAIVSEFGSDYSFSLSEAVTISTSTVDNTWPQVVRMSQGVYLFTHRYTGSGIKALIVDMSAPGASIPTSQTFTELVSSSSPITETVRLSDTRALITTFDGGSFPTSHKVGVINISSGTPVLEQPTTNANHFSNPKFDFPQSSSRNNNRLFPISETRAIRLARANTGVQMCCVYDIDGVGNVTYTHNAFEFFTSSSGLDYFGFKSLSANRFLVVAPFGSETKAQICDLTDNSIGNELSIGSNSNAVATILEEGIDGVSPVLSGLNIFKLIIPSSGKTLGGWPKTTQVTNIDSGYMNQDYLQVPGYQTYTVGAQALILIM